MIQIFNTIKELSLEFADIANLLTTELKPGYDEYQNDPSAPKDYPAFENVDLTNHFGGAIYVFPKEISLDNNHPAIRFPDSVDIVREREVPYARVLWINNNAGGPTFLFREDHPQYPALYAKAMEQLKPSH
jgi:hypothetical protein